MHRDEHAKNQIGELRGKNPLPNQDVSCDALNTRAERCANNTKKRVSTHVHDTDHDHDHDHDEHDHVLCRTVCQVSMVYG